MALVISENIKLPGKFVEKDEVKRLINALEEVSGYSALFIISDSFSRQKHLYKELSQNLSKSIKLIELKSSSDLMDILVTESYKSKENEIFYVLGLDLLLEDLNPNKKERTLNALQNKIDDFVELNRPIVFAIPPHLISDIKGNAPDFWEWQQGIFLFEEKFENKELQINFITDQFINIFGSEKYDQKKELLVLFESLIKEYQLHHNEENSISYMNYLGNVALLYYELGDYKNALDYCYQQRDHVEKSGNDFAMTLIWSNIGQILQTIGQYREAKGIYKRILKKYKKVFRNNFIYRALLLNNIGWIDHLLGDDNEALRHCHHALGMIENYFNPLQIHLVPVLNLMGLVYLALEEEEEALDCFRRILQICERNEGLEHPYIASVMHHIGEVYKNQKDYENALMYFYRWNEKVEKYIGPEHPKFALQLFDVGQLYFDKEDYEKALQYFKWALEIREKALKEIDDPDTAKILFNIGKTTLKLNDNNLAEANKYFENAKNIWTVKLTPEHPFMKEYQSEIEKLKQEPPTKIKTESI